MGVLLDIDGTVLDRGRAIDGAAAAIGTLRQRGVPLLFATNTSRKSRADVAASLREAGVEVHDEEILSASYAAAALLRGRGVRRVHLLLTPAAARDWSDFRETDDAPEAVVVGDLGTSFDFQRLNVAFRCLRAGATLIATQRNRYWHAPDGPTLDAGAFVAALEYAARVDAEVVGKPAAGFFRMAAELLGVPAEQLWIVGDDVESDVAGGRAAGLTTCLVRTGKFDAARLAGASPPETPHHVVDSIADLPALLA
jgi:HAD superfamily hydrolase (TIGR01458 family)